MTDELKGLKVAILATDDFERAELTEPRQALQDAGAQTTVISPKQGEIQAMKHDKKSGKIHVDMALDAANPDDFDGVLIPGGVFNSDALRMEKKAQEFVRKIDQAGKAVAVICHGPWLLISAGLVRGRKLTSYHTIQDDLRNAGANWEDSECVCDRNWVSSRQPTDIPVFNREMINLFVSLAKGRKAA